MNMTHAMTTTDTMGAAHTSARLSSRFDAIDSAKGIGIVLVVFGHAWRGAMGAGLISDAQLFALIDSAVYAFHMPLFFFLSGLLFLEGFQKYKTNVLLRSKVTRLLWPMALWTWLFFGLKIVAGTAANNPVYWADFPFIPLPPFEHLWFLWALFVCQSILILAYKVVPRNVSAQTLRRFAAICALAMATFSSVIYVPSLLWGPMIEHAPYFLAGITAGGFLAVRLPHWVGLVCAAEFAVLLMAVQGEKASVIHSLALLAMGWTVWLWLDGIVAKAGRSLGALCYLGQTSMVIYLTHTAFSAAVRIAMLQLGFEGAGGVVVMTVLAGLTLPVLVLWAARRLHLTKLMGF
jgi:fucose 4-O-acetylase-like acetyltransferase